MDKVAPFLLHSGGENILQKIRHEKQEEEWAITWIGRYSGWGRPQWRGRFSGSLSASVASGQKRWRTRLVRNPRINRSPRAEGGTGLLPAHRKNSYGPIQSSTCGHRKFPKPNLRGWGCREAIRVVWGSWHQSRTRVVKGHPHSERLAATRTSWKRVHRSRGNTHRAAPGPALRDTDLHCAQPLSGKKTASQKHAHSDFKALSGIPNRQWNLELTWMDLKSPGCNNHATVRGQSCSQTACQLPFSAVSQQQQTHCGETFSGSSSLCP